MKPITNTTKAILALLAIGMALHLGASATTQLMVFFASLYSAQHIAAALHNRFK